MGFPETRPTRVRYGVMGYLCSLAFILYVDRVCIGQAGTSMKHDLHLSDTQWGLVGGAFMIAYGVFEVITGHWGDRYGSRRVLTRIVLWWSAFTALTGCIWLFSFDSGLRLPLPWTGREGERAEIPLVFNSFLLLLLVRFLFGAGEAGALPNAARVIARWFPPGGRGPSQALISMSAQIGGAVAPPVAALLILRVGWRWSFLIFGSLGVIWAYFFARWFRDEPAQHPGVNPAELTFIRGNSPDVASDTAASHHSAIPWRVVLVDSNIWLLGVTIACSSFYSYMLFFWFPTYLKEGRGAEEIDSGVLASLPLALGAVGVLAAGYLGDYLTARTGSRRLALCSMGFGGLACAGLLVSSSIHADDVRVAALLCALGFLFADVQLAAWWAAMGDVGGRHLGALFGFCNMIGIAGGFVSQVSLGFFLDHRKALGLSGREQWDPAFYVFGGLLLFGAVCWLFINPTRQAVPPEQPQRD
jgi:sugar phosphate permease